MIAGAVRLGLFLARTFDVETLAVVIACALS